MAMTEPPRCKRFQIHLSTAIMMMFVAGGLMWANLTPVEEIRETENLFFVPDVVTSSFSVFDRETLHNYGWPLWAGQKSISTTIRFSKPIKDEVASRFTPRGPQPVVFYPKEIALDLIVGIAVLYSIYLLRRVAVKVKSLA